MQCSLVILNVDTRRELACCFLSYTHVYINRNCCFLSVEIPNSLGVVRFAAEIPGISVMSHF